MLFHLL